MFEEESSVLTLIPKFLKLKHTKCKSFSWIKDQSHNKMLPINKLGGYKWEKKTILIFDVVLLLLLFCFGHKPTYLGPGSVANLSYSSSPNSLHL